MRPALSRRRFQVAQTGGVPPAVVQDPPPIYRGGSRLIDWKNTARGGMTVDLGIRDIGPLDIHPFKGLNCGKEHGHRLRVIVREEDRAEVSEEDSQGAIYAGEVILMRWGDDSLTGMMVRFLLDAGPDGANGKHPFEGMIAGRKEGEPLVFTAWVVGDDERTQHPARIRRKTPFYELNEIKQSQILCRDQRFISFLAKNEVDLIGGPVSSRPADAPIDFAAEVVRNYLGIASRAELGHDTAAARDARQRWRVLTSRYFQDGWARR